MLASLKAGGVGVTLTAANHAIGDNDDRVDDTDADADAFAVMEPWWNPMTELQAYDRLHRIGQTRQVTAKQNHCNIIYIYIHHRTLPLPSTRMKLTHLHLLQVHIHRLIARNTVEERVVAIQASKLQLSHHVSLQLHQSALPACDPQQVLSGAGRGGKLKQLSTLRQLLQWQ